MESGISPLILIRKHTKFHSKDGLIFLKLFRIRFPFILFRWPYTIAESSRTIRKHPLMVPSVDHDEVSPSNFINVQNTLNLL